MNLQLQSASAVAVFPRSNRLRTAVLGFTVSLALGALLLTGCTASVPSATPSATASAGSAGEIRPDADVPTEVPNTPALRADVEITACERGGDGWKASGTARNSADEDTSYTITVFFTTDKATVLGTGDTTVKVPAGESAEWEIRADLTPASEMRCVLRGVGQ